MKKQIVSIVLAMVIFISQFASMQVSAQNQILAEPQDAASIVSSLTVSSAITQWVMDSSSNTLFAISESGQTLSCINAVTLSVEKTITFAGGPTDIISDSGKLYVAIDSLKQVVVVDIATRTITKTISIVSDPYRIALDGSKLYYTNLNSDVYEHNLETNAEEMLQNPYGFSWPDFAVNTDLHLLYIGESGANICYYSTVTDEMVGRDGFYNDYFNSHSGRVTLYDGKHVFYAGRAFDPSDPNHREGDFSNNQTVMFSKFGCVFTNTNIYNEETHVKIGTLKTNTALFESSANSIFTYNSTMKQIIKYSPQTGTINPSTVIGIVGGTAAATVPETTASTEITAGVRSLAMNSPITRWETDDTNKDLFAISGEDKALFFIDAATFNLKNTIRFVSAPTDIIINGSELYVSLGITHQIKVIDINSMAIKRTIYTSSNPYRIVLDGSKLFYTEFDQWCGIYEYDLDTNAESKLPNMNLYEPDLAINTDMHLLYIGESDLSGSHLYYYNTASESLKTIENGRKFSAPSRDIKFDGEYVYYAGRAFDPSDPNRFEGDYNKNQSILLSKFGCIFTPKSIYEKTSHVKLGDYKNSFDLVEGSNNSIYMYISAEKRIIRYRPVAGTLSRSNIIACIGGIAAEVIPSITESVEVSSVERSLSMPSQITQWITDNASSNLYAISSADKALFFIDSVTLNIVKTIRFSSSPTDILLDGSDLYIALDDSNQIIIIDKDTKTVKRTIYTFSDPFRIAKDGDKLFYTEYSQLCFVYEYNLSTDNDKKIITNELSEPALAINTDKHLLYIGESGSSGSNLYYYSTTENKIVSKTSYANNYGFSFPARITLYDGGYVFYAGRAFDPENPNLMEGDYNNKQAVLFTQFGFAFTSASIYDEDSHIKIGDFKTKVDLIESSNNSFYTYDSLNKKITKFGPQTGNVTLENILTLVNGTPATQIPVETESFEDEPGVLEIEMDSDLTHWISDSTGEYIYAISSADKALFKIEADTLNITGEILYPSAPTDVVLNGNELYVALSDINQISVVNIETGNYVKTLYTTADPFRIVIDGTKLYYTNQNRFCYIYEYDLAADTNKKLMAKSFSSPDLAVNPITHMLYIGESGSTGSNMYYYSLSGSSYFKKTNYNDNYGFYGPARTTLFDGKYVFYAGRAFDPQNPTIIKGTYAKDQDIKSVNNGIVFTDYQIFNESDFKGIYYLSDLVDSVLFTNANGLFLYSRQEKAIISFDSMNRYMKYALDKPTGVKATSAAYNTIKISWDEDYATGHYIYRSDTSTGKYSYIGKSNTTNYTNTSLTLGKKYYYKVIGYITYKGTNVFGDYSSAVSKSALPPTPAPKAASASYNSLKISWKAVSGATGYAIYRYKPSTKTYAMIKVTTALSFADTSLTTGTTYQYKLRSYKTVSGKIYYSDYSLTAIGKPIPGTPGSLRVVRATSKSIKISWNAVSGASGYELHRRSPASGQYELVKTTASTALTYSDVFSGTDCFFMVRAFKTVDGKKIYGAFTNGQTP